MQHNQQGDHRRAWVVIFITGLFLLGACSHSDSTTVDLDYLYALACQDAQVVSEEKIVRDLTPITTWNEDLIWENGPGSRVLVVSWVSEAVAAHYLCPPGGCSSADACKEGRECSQYRYDTWVTVVPELKDSFRTSTPKPLQIAQLLGLPPGDAQRYAYMLEMYVAPQDIFRPCPDPEITDCECELDFPPELFWIFNPTDTVYDEQNNLNTFVDYQTWFTNRKNYIYTAIYPYPWTGLGYTYDWGNPDNYVGLSEFVVHGKREDGSGIAVKINRVCRTDEYFN